MELRKFLKTFTKIFSILFALSIWTACERRSGTDQTPATPGDNTTSQSDRSTITNEPSDSGDVVNQEDRRQEITGGRKKVTPTPTGTPSPTESMPPTAP